MYGLILVLLYIYCSTSNIMICLHELLSLTHCDWSWTYLWPLYINYSKLLYYCISTAQTVSNIRVCGVCEWKLRLTLSHYAGQSSLELVLGLFHLLLMLTLLTRQSTDVAVGGLDHGVEVVGVPAVDLPSFQPGQEHTHRFRKLAIVWQRGVDTKKERKTQVQYRTAKINYSCTVPGQQWWWKQQLASQKSFQTLQKGTLSS